MVLVFLGRRSGVISWNFIIPRATRVTKVDTLDFTNPNRRKQGCAFEKGGPPSSTPWKSEHRPVIPVEIQGVGSRQSFCSKKYFWLYKMILSTKWGGGKKVQQTMKYLQNAALEVTVCHSVET